MSRGLSCETEDFLVGELRLLLKVETLFHWPFDLHLEECQPSLVGASLQGRHVNSIHTYIIYIICIYILILWFCLYTSTSRNVTVPCDLSDIFNS